MTKRHAPSTPATPVQITVEGKNYAGSYYVQAGMITVTGPEGGHRRTQVGGTPVDSLAMLLLSEIVRLG